MRRDDHFGTRGVGGALPMAERTDSTVTIDVLEDAKGRPMASMHLPHISETIAIKNAYRTIKCNNVNHYIKSAAMSLFSMHKPLKPAHLSVRSVQFLVKPLHYCHICGQSHEFIERKSALIKNQSRKKRTRHQAVNVDFGSIQKAPQGAHPRGAKPFSKLSYAQRALSPRFALGL
jgi:hypothetical protein